MEAQDIETIRRAQTSSGLGMSSLLGSSVTEPSVHVIAVCPRNCRLTFFPPQGGKSYSLSSSSKVLKLGFMRVHLGVQRFISANHHARLCQPWVMWPRPLVSGMEDGARAWGDPRMLSLKGKEGLGLGGEKQQSHHHWAALFIVYNLLIQSSSPYIH